MHVLNILPSATCKHHKNGLFISVPDFQIGKNSQCTQRVMDESSKKIGKGIRNFPKSSTKKKQKKTFFRLKPSLSWNKQWDISDTIPHLVNNSPVALARSHKTHTSQRRIWGKKRTENVWEFPGSGWQRVLLWRVHLRIRATTEAEVYGVWQWSPRNSGG